MRALDLDDITVAHCLHPEQTATGTVFRRFPAASRGIVPDIAFDVIESMPTGVRLELVSDTDAVELDVMLTLIQIDEGPVIQAAFDLVVDGEVSATTTTTDGTRILVNSRTGAIDFVVGEPTTIRFDGLGTMSKRLEVWLPHNVVVELRQVRVGDGTDVTSPPSDRPRWVHYGSSISHCMEATRPTGTWPSVAARLAGADLHSLAVAGQCMVDPFAARAIRDATADLISLKLGINVVNGDTMRERTFVPAVHGFIETIRDGHPDTPIVIVTPIFCPSAEQHPGPTVPGPGGRYVALERPEVFGVGALSLERVRQLLADIVAARRAAGDDNLHLISGLDLFGADEIDDLPDHLHPNAAGYQRMGERFAALAFGPGRPFGRTADQHSLPSTSADR